MDKAKPEVKKFRGRLSVIIPCFNEEEVIRTTYERVKRMLETNAFRNHEIIFVDDGSRDRTLEDLEGMAAADRRVKVLSLSRNFGHQAALTAGIHHSSGDLAVVLDADLQDPPEIIPDMVALHLRERCQVVYGVRARRKGETFLKRWTARLYYKLINSMSDMPLPLNTGDFRLMDRQVIEEFKRLGEKNKYVRGLVSWIGFKQRPLSYVRQPRAAGETKYPLKKMLQFAMTGLLYFTKKPLMLAMTLGFISVLAGLALAAYVLVVKLAVPARAVPGWASMLISVIFFGGVQLLSIGLLGRYIGSIFDEVKNRPEYIVARRVNVRKARPAAR